jgi:hypothetical protein
VLEKDGGECGWEKEGKDQEGGKECRGGGRRENGGTKRMNEYK